MGTGWRRAFCTSVPRDDDDQTSPHKPPRNFTSLRFLSGGGSNPTTPRLRCRTTIDESNSTIGNPRFDCKMNPNVVKSVGSTPTSPRSPLKLSLFKSSFKFRSNCGICSKSVKTGQGKAIYTAECAHAFHFPCISDYVRESGKLVCPVCYAIWKDVPLLSIHKNLHSESHEETCSVRNPAAIKTYIQPKLEEKRVIEYSPKFAKTPKNGASQLSPKLCDSRFYDDDEPLMSPITNGKFNPIPEADENLEDCCENEEVEEFQGFFVHPLTKPDEIQSREKDSWAVQVRLLPESAVVSAGRGYETYAVALSVKVPSKDTKATPLLEPSLRAPIDMVTVLDLSDNMTGKRLMMMKRAMALMISSLGSADRLAIVAFSSSPKRLLPLMRMTAQGQSVARRMIDRLVAGEGRNVRDALRKATKVLEDRRERNPVATMLVFADGETQRSLSNHVSSTKHIEIPVHESGFGHFGGYCQGLSVVVQDLRIQLSFASGSAPAEISAVYSLNGRPTALNSGSVRLGELYAGEERKLLVELRVPASSSGSHYVMSVRCLYKDAGSQQVVYGRDQALLVPRPHAVRSCAPQIERLRSLFIATRAMAESRRLIEHGDLRSAYHLLGSSRDLLVQCNMISVDEYVRSLEAEMAEVNGLREMEVEVQRQQMIQRRRVMDKDMMVVMDENGDALTPGSAWRAAERLAKVAMMKKKSMNKVSDLHGFENARF